MIASPTLSSGLSMDVHRYITIKQTLGRRFQNAIRVLTNLDAFLTGLGTFPSDLTAEVFRKWAQTLDHLSANTKLARMREVRNFCLYRRQVAPECFVPDRSLFPKACPLMRPYIFSEMYVAQILGHCDTMPEDPARSPLRWTATRLAIVLLYATGLRRGELFRLTPQDYDPVARTLMIRASKFHKSRLLPLHSELAKEVEQFLQSRLAIYPAALATEPLLRSPYGRNRAYTGTWLRKNLCVLFRRIGIKKIDGREPRVHDFRHSFAVNALIRWYREGVDVQAKLPLLATWLGHVSILSTYHYLQFVEDLRQTANNRFIQSYGNLVVPLEKKGEDR